MVMDGISGKSVSRREAMKTALKAGAYTAPVVLAAAVPAAVSAQVTPTIALGGTVRDGVSFARLAGATVTLNGPGGTRTATTSAGTGNFSFPGVVAGTYTLTVTQPGYITQTTTLTVSNRTVNVNFDLVPPPIVTSATQSNVTAASVTETVTVQASNNLRNFTFRVFVLPSNAPGGAADTLVGTFTTDANGNANFTSAPTVVATTGGTPTSLTVRLLDAAGVTYYSQTLNAGAGLQASGAGTFGPATVNPVNPGGATVS